MRYCDTFGRTRVTKFRLVCRGADIFSDKDFELCEEGNEAT